jgi:hypothetical protein
VRKTATYYAITLKMDDKVNLVGLARRRWLADGGIEDEMLRRDLSWEQDTVITEWKRGEATEELREITEDEADALVEQLREKWQGTP